MLYLVLLLKLSVLKRSECFTTKSVVKCLTSKTRYLHTDRQLWTEAVFTSLVSLFYLTSCQMCVSLFVISLCGKHTLGIQSCQRNSEE